MTENTGPRLDRQLARKRQGLPRMHLRITPEPGSPTRLRIDGRLTAAGVPELLRACEVEPRPAQLELAELKSADEAGLRALKALATGGVLLSGANPYLALLLGGADRTTDEPAG